MSSANLRFSSRLISGEYQVRLAEPAPRVIYCFQAGEWRGKPRGIALADDGKVLANVLCSNSSFLAGDLGINSKAEHAGYDRHFGVGQWKLLWLEQPMLHQDFIEALRRNGARGF